MTQTLASESISIPDLRLLINYLRQQKYDSRAVAALESAMVNKSRQAVSGHVSALVAMADGLWQIAALGNLDAARERLRAIADMATEIESELSLLGGAK